jgi:hypothetical protein
VPPAFPPFDLLDEGDLVDRRAASDRPPQDLDPIHQLAAGDVQGSLAEARGVQELGLPCKSSASSATD